MTSRRDPGSLLQQAPARTEPSAPHLLPIAGRGTGIRELLRLNWPLVAFGVPGLVLLLIFDLGPPLAFNDDWVYAWSVRHLSLVHLHLSPQHSALALVQVIWGYIFSAGSGDPRLLRLSVVPFVVLIGVACRQIALSLGATPRWASLAGVSLLAMPLFMAMATTFMTDVPYVALLMGSAWGATLWLEEGRARPATVVMAILAAFQRQLAFALPVVFAVALLARHRRRPITRQDLLWLGLLWVGVLAAAAIPSAAHFAPANQSGNVASLIANLAHIHPIKPKLLPLVTLVAMLGSAIAPFAIGLVTIPAARRRLQVALPVSVAAILFGIGGWLNVVQVAPFDLSVLQLFPGNVVTPLGTAPTSILGDKPHERLILLYLGAELVAATTFTTVCLLRPRAWTAAVTDGRTWFLVLLAISQVVPFMGGVYNIFDRYYLPVVVPLVPIAAAIASKTVRQGPALGWAVLMIVVGLVSYALTEQDYESWQIARDQAARMAYRMAPAANVAAGYEANGVYVAVPVYESTGVVLDGDIEVGGPPDAVLRLLWAAPRDPRPGVEYQSVDSGKIIIVPGP